jgi:hypothetical protein
MWSQAKNASTNASDAVSLAITASAPGTVGDHAEPVSFTGSWLGQVTHPSATAFSLKGSAKGTPGPIH